MNNIVTKQTFILADEMATIALGKKIANLVKTALKQGIIVFLNGDFNNILFFNFLSLGDMSLFFTLFRNW